jgi:large subunit ribosomal protein L3
VSRFILGKKIGMTQIFSEEGNAVPVTVVKAGPCMVIQKKTIENDGYNAVRIAFEEIPEKRLNKPQRGIYEKLKIPVKKYIKEFKVSDIEKFESGMEIKVSDVFNEGEKVDITGISKGKGFQGVIKRYGHKIGPKSHGSMYFRRPGTMGAGSSPGRVFKGKKLPGHMGVKKVTIQNIIVEKVDGERKLLLLKGSVPGAKGSLLSIKNSIKASE